VDENPTLRALVGIREARLVLDQRERELVSVARSEGVSWGAIADALDESRATIFRRHRDPDTVA
jgi:IS30 family transposase